MGRTVATSDRSRGTRIGGALVLETWAGWSRYR